ncbi:GGDEF domain-containing protein [Actinomycetospora sp. NBRC 106375]|uniref:sensor domain-containing diguanylate cyclase n=1 Tax=Actinomycetospora sp. NBRC 106375 TaxID=3032207 RepID=UPI0024A24233|nr:GGDEF domain-containing protein [Actinomycetospora sp. NBRC 106375]GLZ45901.1 GGDEF domain-containing protein [Actinomycetospora sp. NBRC 106375]
MTTTQDLRVAAGLAPPRAFDAACRMVVDYLAQVVPLDAWAVTRVADGQQTMLVTADAGYGLAPGLSAPWTASMCQYMVAGTAPRIVPDTRDVPDLERIASEAAAQGMDVGTYVGTPIVTGDGALFGTVVGMNREPVDPRLVDQEPLLDLLSSLLSSVLEADTAAVDSARALERAVSDAETDALTSLLNRRGWERWLAREDDRFRRFGDPASVVMLDLDGLKEVNDTEGHDAGDRHLRHCAAVLRSTIRSTDPLARLGGDEFALVAQVGTEDAERLVLRLRDALDTAGVPCSIGTAPFTVGGGFPGACADADALMYENKRARRGGDRSVPSPRQDPPTLPTA